jgi:RimJ/RimL family protein N-acetyltransferase
MVEQVELRTARLLLRQHRLSDADDVYAFAVDPEWSRYLFAIVEPYTRAHAEEFVAKAVLHGWDAGPMLAIVLDSKVIGGINLRVDRATGTGEIGYSIGQEHWGKGLTCEAATALLDWAFPTYDLAKVYARADARNMRSWRVMEKLGMQREGVLRAHRVIAGERSDEVVYGVLREEWRSTE